MQVIELPIEHLVEARWNSNRMDAEMLSRLKASLAKYGVMANLVVRPNGDETYEVLSGNQRLRVLREMGYRVVPCLVIGVKDLEARLLSQALNHIKGEEDLGLRAELVRELLNGLSETSILELLPETAESLRVLAEMGQDTLADYLQIWDRAQGARLKHVTFQLTSTQLAVVSEVLEQMVRGLGTENEGNPNKRGYALYRLCADWKRAEGTYTPPRIREEGSHE